MNERGLDPNGTIARATNGDLALLLQMRTAAATGHAPSADPAVPGMLIDDLGTWLAAEYTAVHGEKTPRPLEQ
jgi:hypothetical protein